MSWDDERLLDICKHVSEEKNAEKLTALISELNDELHRQRVKRESEAVQPEPNLKQRLAS